MMVVAPVFPRAPDQSDRSGQTGLGEREPDNRRINTGKQLVERDVFLDD